MEPIKVELPKVSVKGWDKFWKTLESEFGIPKKENPNEQAYRHRLNNLREFAMLKAVKAGETGNVKKVNHYLCKANKILMKLMEKK